MYAFDYSSFRSVMISLYGSVRNYYESNNIARITEAGWSNGKGSIKVETFVDLCNKHHLCPSSYIVANGCRKDHGTCNKPSSFDVSSLRNLFDRTFDYPLGVTLAQLASALGVSVPTVMSWLGYDSSQTASNNLRMDVLLNIVNTYQINLDDIIRCPYHPIDPAFESRSFGKKYTNAVIDCLRKENAELKSEIERLLNLNERLNRRMESIRAIASGFEPDNK